MKKMFLAVCGLILAFGTSMKVNAMEITLPNNTTFDTTVYAEKNPDVVAVVGDDEIALYEHYLQFGMNEGRPFMGTEIKSVTMTDGVETILFVGEDGRTYQSVKNIPLGTEDISVVPSSTFVCIAHEETLYDPANAGGNRENNMQIAASAINGTVLQPGEEFSYSLTVGPRTAARGFKIAGVFAGGKVSKGIGGGICQVSSTLYSALLETDITVLERHPHSRSVTYLPKGRDAAISWGAQDLRIKNNHANPITIQAFVENGKVNVFVLEERP